MTRCSDAGLAESMAGTAPQRKVWLIIEQPGTWGSNALVESNLPEGFGQLLIDKLSDPLIGIALARRPEVVSQERRTTRRRRLWLAHTAPGGVRMRAGSLDDIRDVLTFDWSAILRGELPAIGRRSADPVLFVCTNGKRDQCCAIKGRDIVDTLRPDKELTGQVYEASHLGGHRFAPTALLLPYGEMFGRLTVDATRQLLQQSWSGHMDPAFSRGRSALPAWAQAAKLEVRRRDNITGIDVLDVVMLKNGKALPLSSTAPENAEVSLQVRHHDGRAWNVEMKLEVGIERPISCGSENEVAHSWRASSVVESDRWHA